MYILYKLNLPLRAYFLIYGPPATGLSMYLCVFLNVLCSYLHKNHKLKIHIVIVPNIWLT